MLDQGSARPDGFNLAAAWAEIASELRGEGDPVRLTARARPWVPAILSRMPGIEVDVAGAVEADGWQHLDLSSGSAEALTGLTAAFGSAVEVTGPEIADEGHHRMRIGLWQPARDAHEPMGPGPTPSERHRSPVTGA